MDLETQSDESLVLQCQQGQGQFFGQLYERYFEKIYNFIYYRTRHKQTAEDLTAQVFYKTLNSLLKFNAKKGKFSTWIFSIARNGLIDFYRTNHNTEDIENAWDLSSADNLEKSADTAAAMASLAKALQTLEKQQREVVLMRLWDGLSYKEIAEILNLGESNCKMIFRRTLEKLQKQTPTALLLLFLIKNL